MWSFNKKTEKEEEEDLWELHLKLTDHIIICTAPKALLDSMFTEINTQLEDCRACCQVQRLTFRSSCFIGMSLQKVY